MRRLGLDDGPEALGQSYGGGRYAAAGGSRGYLIRDPPMTSRQVVKDSDVSFALVAGPKWNP